MNPESLEEMLAIEQELQDQLYALDDVRESIEAGRTCIRLFHETQDIAWIGALAKALEKAQEKLEFAHPA